MGHIFWIFAFWLCVLFLIYGSLLLNTEMFLKTKVQELWGVAQAYCLLLRKHRPSLLPKHILQSLLTQLLLWTADRLHAGAGGENRAQGSCPTQPHLALADCSLWPHTAEIRMTFP